MQGAGASGPRREQVISRWGGGGSCTGQQATYSLAPGKLLRNLQLGNWPPGTKRSRVSKDENEAVPGSEGP